MLKVKTPFGEYDVYTHRDVYELGATLFVDLYCVEDGFIEPFAALTKNIPDKFMPCSVEQLTMAPIDTNNCPWAEQFLVENHLAEPTGVVVTSGWCEYPIYKFNIEELDKHKI